MSPPHLCTRLPAEPLETIRQFRGSRAFVSELGDEHRERLGIAGDPQGPGVHRIEAGVADQAGCRFFAARSLVFMRDAHRLISISNRSAAMKLLSCTRGAGGVG